MKFPSKETLLKMAGTAAVIIIAININDFLIKPQINKMMVKAPTAQ